jgi:hypothetical protein
VQFDLPRLLALPMAHGVHSALALNAAARPAAQSAQYEDPAADVCPEAHAKQEICASAGWKVPAAHELQCDAALSRTLPTTP